MSSPLVGNYQSWERQQPTEWGPLREEDGGCFNRDDAAKTRFTTGVYSNTWETRARSLNIEVVVEKPFTPYVPPLSVNPSNPTAWISIMAQGRSLGSVTFELKGGDYNIRAEDGSFPKDQLFDLSLVEYRRGGRSIYEEVTFGDENLDLKHEGQASSPSPKAYSTLTPAYFGILSVASENPGVNGSQFFVTLPNEPLSYLDGRYQVFGQVLEGME
eukprot:scaffold53359_cov26-Prasinocladus_malaysianus.AAC.1